MEGLGFEKIQNEYESKRTKTTVRTGKESARAVGSDPDQINLNKRV